MTIERTLGTFQPSVNVQVASNFLFLLAGNGSDTKGLGFASEKSPADCAGLLREISVVVWAVAGSPKRSLTCFRLGLDNLQDFWLFHHQFPAGSWGRAEL